MTGSPGQGGAGAEGRGHDGPRLHAGIERRAGDIVQTGVSADEPVSITRSC